MAIFKNIAFIISLVLNYYNKVYIILTYMT